MSLSEVRRIAESLNSSACLQERTASDGRNPAGRGHQRRDDQGHSRRRVGSCRQALSAGRSRLSGFGIDNVHGLCRRPRCLGFGAPCDGGDTETGYRMNIAGNIELAAPAHGLTVSPVGWSVLTREAPDLKGGGIAGSLARNPSHSNGRGSKLKMNQAFRTGGPGGRDALLVRDTLEKLAANGNGNHLQQRLEARFNANTAMSGSRSTSMPEIRLDPSEVGRDYGLGLAADLRRGRAGVAGDSAGGAPA